MKAVLQCKGGNCGKFWQIQPSEPAYRASKAVGFKNYPCPRCQRTTHNVESTLKAMQADAEARYQG